MLELNKNEVDENTIKWKKGLKANVKKKLHTEM